jgi:hypothetical protein
MTDEKSEVKVDVKSDKKATKPNPSKAENAAEKLIYLGPAMLERDESETFSFQIGYGTIYSNGLPEDVEERVKKDKDFSKLFVPVKDVTAAMKKLKDESSDLFAAKKKVSDNYFLRKKDGR